MITADDCEEIARRASDESTLNTRERVSPRLLAAGYLRLRLSPRVGASAHLDIARGRIVYDPTDAPEAQAYMIAHEAAHWLLRDEGWVLPRDLEERAASRIGVALMLPRRAYLESLRSTGWDLVALRRLWPLASMWILARRIVELTHDGAIASRWTARKLEERVVSETIENAGRVTPIESALSRAARAGVVGHAGDRLRAWPEEPSGAIVLCGADELRAALARPRQSAQRAIATRGT